MGFLNRLSERDFYLKIKTSIFRKKGFLTKGFFNKGFLNALLKEIDLKILKCE